MHGFQQICHVILQCGGLDDPGDGAGTDQEDGDADDLAQAELCVLHQVFGMACHENAYDTAHGQCDQRVDGNAEERTQCQQDDDHQRAENGGQKAGQILCVVAFQIGGRDGIVFLFGQQCCQENGDDERQQRGNDVLHHDRGQRLLESLRHRDGVGVGRNDIAGLAAADHGQQHAALAQPSLLADGQRDGSDSDHGNINENAHGADDHGGDGDGHNRPLFPQLVHDRFRDLLGGAGFDERTGQDAAGQNTEDGGHHGARSADHGIDGSHQSAAADEAADQRAEDKAVGRSDFADDEDDGDGKPDEGT